MARATFSKYLVFPTNCSFPKTVRILAICVPFVKAFTDKWMKKHGHTDPTVELLIHYNSFLLPGKSQDPMILNSVEPIHIQDGPPTIQWTAHGCYYKKYEALCSLTVGSHGKAEGPCSQKDFGFLNCFRIRDRDIQWPLHYLYKTATAEVKHFIKSEKINKKRKMAYCSTVTVRIVTFRSWRATQLSSWLMA